MLHSRQFLLHWTDSISQPLSKTAWSSSCSENGEDPELSKPRKLFLRSDRAERPRKDSLLEALDVLDLDNQCLPSGRVYVPSPCFGQRAEFGSSAIQAAPRTPP